MVSVEAYLTDCPCSVNDVTDTGGQPKESVDVVPPKGGGVKK